jgi:glycosyltransferase involved in cell wall biosynthesis
MALEVLHVVSKTRPSKVVGISYIAKEHAIAEQVAIIVIAFNEESRVTPCLTALLHQDSAVPYKVIVVDDASQDSTVANVKKLQPMFPNLQLVQHEVNRGRGAARRSGQDATDAKWIGFVDSDIVVPSNWLQRCLEELAEVDGVSGIAQPDGDCAVIWRICQPSIRQRPGSAEITGNNVLFSRDALKSVPFSPQARLGEDFRLAKLMTKDGFRLRTIEDLKVEHRETKTYLKGVSWMWESGLDASSLPFEFKILRMPDLAWLVWLLVSLTPLVAIGLDLSGIVFSLIDLAVMTLIVDAVFIYSRFTPRPHFSRFLAALVISPPMMFAYLTGRTAGLLQVAYRYLHNSATNNVR